MKILISMEVKYETVKFVNQILETGGSNISKQINKNNQTLFSKQCVGIKI